MRQYKRRIEDPVGKWFGPLEVVEDLGYEREKSGQLWVKVRCAIGHEAVRGYDKISDGTASCIECHRIAVTPKSSVGEVFGRLTVIEELAPVNKRRDVICKCSCEAGTIVKRSCANALRRNVRAGIVPSCGCYLHEVHRKYGIANCKSEYLSWFQAKDRCQNEENSGWKDYGGRGIAMCPEWSDQEVGFKKFYKDMGPKPTPKHTLDRRDVNGPYAPWNCRWATMREQNQNRRNTVTLTLNGKEEVLVETARRVNMRSSTLRWRINKLGLTPEEAATAQRLKTPAGYRKPALAVFNGRHMRLVEIAREAGVDYHCLYRSVVVRKQNIEEAVSTLQMRIRPSAPRSFHEL